MEEFIRVLRGQLVLCQELLKIGKRHRESLLTKDAAEMATVIARTDEYMGRIAVLERQKQGLLKRAGFSTLAALLAAGADTEETELLRALAGRVQEACDELKDSNQRLALILQKYSDFVDFSVNVMTQTTNDNVYAKQGGTPASAVVSKKKMFDQTI